MVNTVTALDHRNCGSFKKYQCLIFYFFRNWKIQEREKRTFFITIKIILQNVERKLSIFS